jgi:hypothetical protein
MLSNKELYLKIKLILVQHLHSNWIRLQKTRVHLRKRKKLLLVLTIKKKKKFLGISKKFKRVKVTKKILLRKEGLSKIT